MEKSTRTLTIVGVVLLTIGLIAWIVQLTGGLLGGSNMTNIFLWGLMIAMFAFLVGFGAGSQFVASAIFLFGKEELKPLGKIAAACGLACVCAAGIAILADLGAVRNAMAMNHWHQLTLSACVGHDCYGHLYCVSIIQLIMIARNAGSVKVWAALAGIAAACSSDC